MCMEEEPYKLSSDDIIETKVSRRGFLKLAGLGAGVAVTAPMVYSVMKGWNDFSTYVSPRKPLDRPIDIELEIHNIPNKTRKKPHIVDLEYNGHIIKLFGVEHSKQFVKSHHKTIDELISGASCVVNELSPDYYHPYFSHTASICKKYDKPIVYLDSYSDKSMIVDHSLSAMGFIIAAYNSFTSFRNPSKKEVSKKCAGIGIGAYLFGCGTAFSRRLKMLLFNKGSSDDIFKTANKSELLFLSHGYDQRSVELVRRTKLLIDKGYSDRDDYILVNYGRAHTQAFEFYFNHPKIFELKNISHNVLYHWNDNDICKIYTTSSGKWNTESLFL
jgi:hypothetical protein